MRNFWRRGFKEKMNVLLVGPIASGKGTQAQKLVKKFNLAHLEMGALFRSITKKDTVLGNKVKKFLDKGQLVTDEITTEVVENYLQNIGKLDGILFDGFPRILSQAQYFEKFMKEKGLKIDVVIYLTLPKQKILERILNRRTCSGCGQVYNRVTNPSKIEGVCDLCGGKLIARSDETPEKTTVRIEWFERQVVPMINYYRKKGMVEEVDGDRPIEVIFQDIVKRLKKRGLLKNA